MSSYRIVDIIRHNLFWPSYYTYYIVLYRILSEFFIFFTICYELFTVRDEKYWKLLNNAFRIWSKAFPSNLKQLYTEIEWSRADSLKLPADSSWLTRAELTSTLSPTNRIEAFPSNSQCQSPLVECTPGEGGSFGFPYAADATSVGKWVPIPPPPAPPPMPATPVGGLVGRQRSPRNS